MTDDQFLQLLQGFHQRSLNDAELRTFLSAIDNPHFELLLGDRLYQELLLIKTSAIVDGQRAGAVWEKIRASIPAYTIPAEQYFNGSSEPVSIPRIPFYKRPWLRYAAAIIVLAGIGVYSNWEQFSSREPEPQVATQDLPPGREGAVLTLADGTRMLLDSMDNGLVTSQHGTEVALQDGRLVYNATKADAVAFNTISTPRGRQYSMLLPDGSRAWLNASSSITLPTAFIGSERTVKISGEVYFEIVKDAMKPFKVTINNHTEVQVLGTSFDVKAYSDDAGITTTLVDGAVRVVSFERGQTLKPGQQTLSKPDGSLVLVPQVDMGKTLAWKNGLFNFENESFEEVMKQLERWYDIEVKYVGKPPKQKFFGELQRDLTLSQVIESLKEVGVQFKIEGRTLVVTP